MWNDQKKVLHLSAEKTPRKSLTKDRMYAFTMDLFLIGIINKAILFTYTSFIHSFFHQLPLGVRSNLQNKLQAVNSLNFLVVFIGYFLLSYYLSEGKTPGKIMFNLKVQCPHTHSDQLSLKTSVLRTLGYFVTIPTGFTLLLIPCFRKDGKGIPDWLSDSFVMNSDEEYFIETLEDSGSSKVTPLFPEDPVAKKIGRNKAS
ncbi:RDD family protein [Halobacteriovorax sp.]|uniref:RDD family protein n=1 Tax=Halobacteriovorax sp. TaxID=2020862 RepID=UPI00356621B6